MKVTRKIKVLIVDDSLLFRETLAREFAKDFGIEVIGTASDPFMARDKILELKPDVVTLDVEMPKMDGIEFLKKLMPQYPLPVIVVSSVGNNVFEALNAGAVDFVTKPDAAKKGSMNSFINELIVKIKIASTAQVGQFKKDYVSAKLVTDKGTDIANTILAIGASTGGTEAIYNIIKTLPRDMPGILIVQHMPPVFTKMYADRLNNSCKLEVKEAADGDLVKPGRVLVAAGDFHMRLAKSASGYFVKCARGEKVSGHCPSVDVLFDSVAEVAKNKAIGVILTGMGSDGAKGLLNMKKQGAYTIGQDEKTSVVYGMPMVAYNIGAVDKQLPLDKIPQEICDHLALEL
ncbi:protein-glutamate methylesterase/protein-glutamine glutaminase [Sinanaerobacter chloroacetimidivorans]|uniref:Protein-glutamate methylesterase/protein-glutamine glutaminase n=1 Tax=Sinanaerobacter chloroacetimidivorans TaxID=2818044 RepID=A0A8J7VZG9_9FIRM|nr:chemotaxis response regulator protein-glutamate methylesterase [Sinanaerobacter chloroacetimidivorans]MBR0597559.1 chemotaxis response regulator protein-glutamate methylesterase [Sinanaerobacter chloroacetimidivorans]